MKLHLIISYALLTAITACNIIQKVEKTESKTYTMIMDLKKEVDPQAIVKQYADYGLSDLKRISKSKNTWSAKVNFKTDKLMEKAMQSMKTDKRILSVKMVDNKMEKPNNSTNGKKGTSKLGGRD